MIEIAVALGLVWALIRFYINNKKTIKKTQKSILDCID